MSDEHDWLRVLELEPGVSFDEIRRAHRDMAKVWHPDRFPNDRRLKAKAEEHLKAVNEAFENLERWVKSGKPLPTPGDLSGGARMPPVHKRHPLRDTWTVRTPLGIDDSIQTGSSRGRVLVRWIAGTLILLGLVAALLAGMVF